METYSAKEAAEALGVGMQTLYAYVSRGLIASEPGPGTSRARRYPKAAVDAFVRRRAQRHDAGAIAANALDWGTPVLASAITLIDGGRLYYRGVEAIAWADGFEAAAAWLWTGDPGAAFPADAPPPLPALPPLDPVAACQAMLPHAAAADPAAGDLRPAAVARAGARILRAMAATLAGREAGRTLAGTLAAAWGTDAVAAIDRALVLAADHELNASAFAVRIAASARATPYDAVAAGLATLRGGRHGGMTARVAALFDEVGSVTSPGRAVEAIAARLRRDEGVPGFGQALYPHGDPRGRALLDAARELRPDAMALPEAIAAAGREVLGEHPTIDFGLVALARALGLPPEAPLAIFALGRTAGWIAHALEQYDGGALIRPRARYVGPAPG